MRRHLTILGILTLAGTAAVASVTGRTAEYSSGGTPAVVEESDKGLVVDVGDPVCQSYGGLRLG